MPTISDEVLEKFEVSSNLISKTDLNTNFWINNFEVQAKSTTRIQGNCIATCQETFINDDGNKVKERGACKAECWANIIIKAATVIGTFISK